MAVRHTLQIYSSFRVPDLTDCWFCTFKEKAKNNTPIVKTLERNMSFLNRSVSPGQRSNSPIASNYETELQENHPTEAEDKLFLTKQETGATIDGQEQLNSVSNGNISNGGSLLQTADEKSDVIQGQILCRVALLAMCLLIAVSLVLTLLMLLGVLHVGSPQCTCSGETGIYRFTRCFILNFNSYLQIDCALDTLLFWIIFRCQTVNPSLWKTTQNWPGKGRQT